LAGVAIYIFASPYPAVYWALTIIIIALGVWGSGIAETEIFHSKDSPEIVIDEVGGFLLSMAFFQLSDGYFYIVLGYLFFRLFDIWKPWPIKKLQDLPRGWGVMFDDLLAGVYTNIVLLTVYYLMSYYSLLMF
ncbi:MAG: phosphatidylglycerophosphatase A, partial [Spirochaetota bacterium]|nr:phosphatidylglycerophosphatase A [Spirochaetota bacterium]